jgi:hypothetical protein
MRLSISSKLFPKISPTLILPLVLAAGFGCAGVKPMSTSTGGGGSGGMMMINPAIPGLTGLTVSPPSTNITLTNGSTPGTLTGSASYTANGTFMDGSSMDVTARVNWSASPSSGTFITNGNVTITAPGSYTITATSGNVTASATLTAVFSGGFTCTDFDTSGSCASFSTGTETTLDGTPSGTTTIAYPLDGSLFPANLGPIQVQTTTSGTSARINFQTTSGNVNVNFYGSCEAGPGPGCYVTIPVAFTQLLIPGSASENIHLTARVSSGGAPSESAPVSSAWAPTGLTGGLYFWTVVPHPVTATSTNDIPTPPTYLLLDPTQTSGTQIQRYDFSRDNPAPEVVWTDDGGPGSTPPYDGAPQAFVNGVAGGHCIGCHTITNDGKYMALTIGGSSTYNAANWEMLDIGGQALELINPVGGGGADTSSDPSATPTNDPTNYWKSYRKETFATEVTWNPDSTVMANMYMSKLYLSSVAISGTSATVTRTGPAVPTYQGNVDPYGSDPFWSHDGSMFVFTSFNQAATADSTGNPQGLNGDLKTGGQIAIASATATSVNDDAKVLVTRGAGVSSYYPCISEDSAYVVFNQSTCGSNPDPVGGGYGTGSCDGYDDSSAKLWWVPTSGGATTLLNNANGGSNNYDNSWPRFSPDVGTFRGNKLYWVAFSSRRPYGVQVNNTSTISATQPQLWFAAVSVGEITIGDPSFAPVWLPGQNPMQASPYGNHVPQWVKVAIKIDSGL